MKLQEVLEMLAPFGIQEEEARQLIAQDDGWQIIQTRVNRTFEALVKLLSTDYDSSPIYLTHQKIMSLKLKSVKKSPKQEQQEQRDLADKFKNNGKKPSSVEDLKEMANAWEGMGLGKIF